MGKITNEFTLVTKPQQQEKKFKNEYFENNAKTFLEDFKLTLKDLNEFDLGSSASTKEAYLKCQEFMVYYRVLNITFDMFYRKAYNVGLTALSRLTGKEKSEVHDKFKEMLTSDTEWARMEILK